MIRIRVNGRTDKKTYLLNTSIPQGTPLSPYLFGCYIKRIVKNNNGPNTLTILYVDDIVIGIAGENEEEMEATLRKVWGEIQRTEKEKGIDFRKNKSKTWHDRKAEWSIGKSESYMRILGYWLSTDEEIGTNKRWTKHIRHWTTEANYMFNVIRALS